MSDQSDHTASLSPADIVRSDRLRQPGVRHAFFTRRGGVSDGIYASLNAGVGSSDDAERVRENRRRAAVFLGVEPDRLATPWQTHSADAVKVSAPFAGERPKADGIVTDRPGLAIGIVTADCGPILFADAQAGVIGAAHAGWRGALGGVLEQTIRVMEELGAERGRIEAVLGPCITQDAYEVGEEMMAEFTRVDPDWERFFRSGTRPTKRQFDLPGFILARLESAGVSHAFVERCTYREADSFFSFRRTTHHGEPDYGRQMSAIALG